MLDRHNAPVESSDDTMGRYRGNQLIRVQKLDNHSGVIQETSAYDPFTTATTEGTSQGSAGSRGPTTVSASKRGMDSCTENSSGGDDSYSSGPALVHLRPAVARPTTASGTQTHNSMDVANSSVVNTEEFQRASLEVKLLLTQLTFC